MLPPNGERRAGPATHWLSCSDERDIHADASRTPSLPVPSWSQCATCLDESLDELVRGRNVRGLLRADAHIPCDIGLFAIRRKLPYRYSTVPVKRHRGEPGHTRDTGQTRGAEPHNHPNPPTHPPTRATAGRPNPRPTHRPQPPEPTAPRGRLRLRPEAAPRPPPANPVPVPSATPTADNVIFDFRPGRGACGALCTVTHL